MSALARQRVLPNLYQAAKRGCIMVLLDRAPRFLGSFGDAMCRSYFALRFDHPDDVCPAESIVWGTKAKPPVCSIFPAALL